MKRVKTLKRYEPTMVAQADETPLDPISEITFFGKTVRRLEPAPENKTDKKVDDQKKIRCVIL